jgi:hypothetical protein
MSAKRAAFRRLRQKLSKIDATSAVAAKHAFIDIRIVREQIHAPWLEQLRDPAADAPHADDADRDAGIAVLAPSDVHALEARGAPAAGLDVRIALTHTLEQRKH